MRFKYIKDLYVYKPLVNAAVNSFGIYGGIRSAAFLAEKLFDAEGLADGLNLSSPLVSGSYVLHRAKEIKTNFLRDVVKVGTASLMGAATFDSLDSSFGSVDWSGSLKSIAQKSDILMSKLTGTESASVNGFTMGFASGLAGVLSKYLPRK